jgi:hypothetical protein
LEARPGGPRQTGHPWRDVTSSMATFRVHVSSAGLRSKPIELLRELMLQLSGAGGIIPVSSGCPAGDFPVGFTYLFCNDDYETCSDFRRRLQGLIESVAGQPVELAIERMDDAIGVWVTD